MRGRYSIRGKYAAEEDLENEVLCFECANYLVNFEERIDVTVDGRVFKNVLSIRLSDDGATFQRIVGPELV